jgi:ribose transport system permease protein
MTKNTGTSHLRMQFLSYLGKYGTIIALALMIICFGILLPPFRSPENLVNLLGQMALLSIFAAGMTCTLKMGDFDLSIGAIAAITGIVVASLLAAGYSIPVAVGLGLLTGIACGVVNGLLVAYVELSAFVCTLATMSIILGGAMALTKGLSIWELPAAFGFIGRGDFYLGIPNRFIIMIVLFVILALFHAYTPTGRRMEAIGGNPDASRMSGINVRFHRLLGFILSGFCSSIAGIVLTSALMSANSTQGTTYLLDAFGACFIGAATMRIGQFHIWGTLVGVMIVVVAVNGLIIMMVPGYYTTMIQGVILLLAILLSSTGTRLLKR